MRCKSINFRIRSQVTNIVLKIIIKQVPQRCVYNSVFFDNVYMNKTIKKLMSSLIGNWYSL